MAQIWDFRNTRLSVKHILFKAFSASLSISYRQPDLAEQINRHLSRVLHSAAGLRPRVLMHLILKPMLTEWTRAQVTTEAGHVRVYDLEKCK